MKLDLPEPIKFESLSFVIPCIARRRIRMGDARSQRKPPPGAFVVTSVTMSRA